MHAQNIFAFLALAIVAMSAAIPAAVPAPNAGKYLLNSAQDILANAE